MPISEKDRSTIALAIPPSLACCFNQPFDFGFGTPFVCIHYSVTYAVVFGSLPLELCRSLAICLTIALFALGECSVFVISNIEVRRWICECSGFLGHRG